MNRIFFVLITLTLLLFALSPVQAYTATALAIAVAPDGDADLIMQYELSPLEQTAVFLQIADPAGELKKAFDTQSLEPVTVAEATGSSAIVHIPGFADVKGGSGRATLVTPALSFVKAEEVMNSYWFAPLLSPDFSPAVTTVTFPDGYKTTYYDVLTVPSVTHRLTR